MSSTGQEVMDRIERSIGELIRDANEASASARMAWIIFMAMIAFFVIALAGVTHKDLLLETPVDLPLLQVKVPQASFFLFGPLILLLVHLNLLMQHVTLSRKLKDTHDRLTRHEGNGFFRQHRLRSIVHSYAMAQAVAGPWRSKVLGAFLHAVNWTTLVLLPVLVLLNFQITYLPLHDATATALHRGYLAADLLILLLLGMLILVPDLGFGRAMLAGLTRSPLALISTVLLGIAALVFAFLIATIPDERLDRMATSLWPETVKASAQPGGTPRMAFTPTAWLFDGPPDEIQGRPDSLFSRNLIVINTPLVPPVNPEPDDPSLNLRGRDLKYATFDRSDMRRADMTGADLTGTSMVQTGLTKARLNQATLTGTDLRGAAIISTFARGAKLDGVRVCSEQRMLFLPALPGGDDVKGLVKENCPRDR
jgi:hypothetical protein